MKPTHYFALLLWVSGVMSSIAQNTQRVIVQLEMEVEMKKVVKDFISKNTMETKLNPIKCLSKTLNIWLMEVETVSAEADIDSDGSTLFLEALREEKGTKSVQYDRPVVLRTVPNDSLYTKQWQYKNEGSAGALIDADIDAPEAWEITTGGQTVTGDEIVIAIIDGGIDLQHPDLSGNIWENLHEIPNNQIDDDVNGYVDDTHGWNFKMNNASVDNDRTGHWHGTPVAGIVGAMSDNAIGVSGVNWNIKMMNLVANSTIADIIAAYDYILEMRKRYNHTDGKEGAFVVATNTSLGIGKGFPDEAPVWCAMFDALGEEGILSVTATANENIDVDREGDLPTTCTSDFLIGVTGTNPSDNKSDLTAYGLKSVDLGAPGVRILTVANRSSYDYFGGTSAATPHVAGAVGLLYSSNVLDFINEVKKDPAGSALKIKNFILSSVDPLPSLHGKCVTGGRLNLNKSLIVLYEHFGTEPVIQNSDKGIILNKIYPNPAHESFNLDFMLVTKTNGLQVQLYDIFGRRVKAQEVGNLDKGRHSIEVSLGAIAKGMYIVKFNQTSVIKLLVN